MLNRLLLDAASRTPDAIAVVGDEVSYSYAQLAAEGARIAHALSSVGVGPSDRVAIWMKKSPMTVAAMHGVLQLGAIYVPLDPVGPAKRAATILEDCTVSALIHDRAADEDCPFDLYGRPTLSLHNDPRSTLNWDDLGAYPADIEATPRAPRDLAFILYTSGSTGTPKGVCISHENALAFVNWAADAVAVKATDRLSNHAPFHFDLSVFDLYVTFRAAASVYLVPESISYLGASLESFIEDNGITIWYSVPTAIIIMCDNGSFLDNRNLKLHTLIFAGEVFPIKNLARVQQAHRQLRLLNFFGPTETNVCTWHEVTEDLQDHDRPVPIGAASSGDLAWVRMETGEQASEVGQEGELIICGPSVMAGYWGKDPLPQGHHYATGDLVRLLPQNRFYYLGRKDNMVKIQGFRVELGEIEAILARYEGLETCAVVVVDRKGRKELVAFAQYRGEKIPSLIQLKLHCASSLPRYMVIQRAIMLDDFPRTANGKIDRLRLTRMAQEDV